MGEYNLLRRRFLLAFSLTMDRFLSKRTRAPSKPCACARHAPCRQTDSKRSGRRPAVNRDGSRVRWRYIALEEQRSQGARTPACIKALRRRRSSQGSEAKWRGRDAFDLFFFSFLSFFLAFFLSFVDGREVFNPPTRRQWPAQATSPTSPSSRPVSAARSCPDRCLERQARHARERARAGCSEQARSIARVC